MPQLKDTTKYEQVLSLRDAGFTYQQVADELHISREWAFQIAKSAKEAANPPALLSWTNGLSSRVAHALQRRYGGKDAFLQERERRLSENMCKYIADLGPLGEIEILNWLGVRRHVCRDDI